jgi:SAM-dependent methyltransferase
LNSGARILEVGGGILALAIQLASEGFIVTAVEPVGEGFSDVSFLMKIFSQIAVEEKISFNLVEKPIEESSFTQTFEFIYSINVMEHLRDPYSALDHIMQMIAPGGTFRFMCPNYNFPYEPHFGRFIFRRRNSAFFLTKRRARRRGWTATHNAELYSSINFLTYKKIRNHAFRQNYLFLGNKSALSLLVRRSLLDLKVRDRHRNLYILVLVFSKLRLLSLTLAVPVKYQPVMDICVSKQSESGS